MDPRIILPTVTSILALVFSVALFDQWRERRGGFQLIWAFGMLFYGVGAGCEALGALSGWNELLYRTWYLTGAVWTAGWLRRNATIAWASSSLNWLVALLGITSARPLLCAPQRKARKISPSDQFFRSPAGVRLEA